MTTQFLDWFGTTPYDFSGNGDFATATNISKYITLTDSNSSTAYIKYNIPDGMRPDQVSQELYSSPKYYWMLFLFNVSLKEGVQGGWPLSYSEFDDMIAHEYDPYFFVSDSAAPDMNNNRLADIPLRPEYEGALSIAWEVGGCVMGTGLQVQTYNHNMMGVIASVGDSAAMATIGIDDTENTEALFITHDGSAAGLAWQAECESLGLYVYGGDAPAGIAIPLTVNRDRSHAMLKNATYQYYITVDGEDTPVSSYDVLSGDITTPFRITCVEYEEILNNRKKTIRVPRPELVSPIQDEYIRLVQTS